MQTEYKFTLPRGVVGDDGRVHRDGVMRLATARDEIEPMRAAGVRQNGAELWELANLSVLLLARVVTRVGDVTDVTPEFVESLDAADLDHLERLYARLNTGGDEAGAVTCPHCEQAFEVELTQIDDALLGK